MVRLTYVRRACRIGRSMADKVTKRITNCTNSALELQVAVKKGMAPESSTEAINVLREIECFSYIKHPNVLPFIGACLSDPEECLLVTEYMPGGNLKDWLHGRPGQGKPTRRLSERLTMALHVRFRSSKSTACE
jgi:serine/threonine protein kinase